MGCEEYRLNLELVSSLEDGEPSLQPTIAHIKECPQCAQTYAAIQNFDLLIEKQIDVEVPPFLASRVSANLPRQAPQVSSFQWAYAMGAFLFITGLLFYNQIKIVSRLEQLNASMSRIALTPVATQPVVTQPPANNTPSVVPAALSVSAPAMDLAPSHNVILSIIANHAIKRHKNIMGSKFVVFDNDKVNKDFQSKFNFPLVLPNFSNELKLVGGSKCHSCNYEMAYLLYRHGRDSVSLCMFPASEFGLSQWLGRSPYTLQKDEHNVAVWKKGETVYALVFKIPVTEVRSLVWDLKQK